MATKRHSRSGAASKKSTSKAGAKRPAGTKRRQSVPGEPEASGEFFTPSRLVEEILAGLSGAEGRAKRKVSVTVDADLWDEVSRLVAGDSAVTASAAVETGLAMWAANQRLRELLEEVYGESPDARPTEDQVTAAAELLGLR